MALAESQFVSTVEDPIKFFQAFYEGNYLEVLRNNFMPNPNNPEDWQSKSAIDVENETYTVEFLKEVSFIEEEIDGTPYRHAVEEVEESITVSFKDYLIKKFDFQSHKSIELIEQLIPNLTSSERAELMCKVIMDKLLYFIQANKEGRFIKYEGLEVYIENIIRLLYNKYNSFCQSYKNNIRVKNIVSQKPVAPIVPDKKFKNGIYKLLATLEFDDINLVEYDHLNPIEIGKVENAIWSIMHKESKEAEIVLNFNWGNRPVNYLLRQLNKYEPLMSITEIDKSEKVLIKNVKFSAGASYAAATRFEKNPGKSAELKEYIDKFISDNLM